MSDKGEQMSSILDDAQEKIAELFRIAREEGAIRKWVDGMLDAKEALNLSGTTDIMCDECDGGWHEFTKPCPKCQGEKSIKHKWKIAVVLEHGELPIKNPMCSEAVYIQDILHAGYVEEVRQAG